MNYYGIIFVRTYILTILKIIALQMAISYTSNTYFKYPAAANQSKDLTRRTEATNPAAQVRISFIRIICQPAAK